MRTNADITIYNKYASSHNEVYSLSQVLNVAWENRKGSNVLRTGGNIEADQAAIYIPFSSIDDYIEPRAWQALVTKTGKWTLQTGDYIVRGLVSDTIGSMFTLSDLKRKYNDVLRVTTVDRYDNGSFALRHFKVGAA